MRKAVFISGTDTGIGKTVITSAITLGIRMMGIDCGVMKPVQCAGDDASVLKRVSHSEDPLELINPYYFSRPLSPHLAAKLERRRISIERIIQNYESLRKKHQFLVVEGAGGLLVPLKNNFLVADFIQELNIPAIIVARLSLGTINHSLLTIEAARNRGIKVIGIIFNQMTKGSLTICGKTNPEIISKLSRVKVMGVIPYLESLNKRNADLKGLRETAKRIDIPSILKS